MSQVFRDEWNLRGLEEFDADMAEIWKGLAMFRTMIVAWLVILVVALTVVTVVTRIIEKYRPSNRVRALSERRP